MRSIRAFTTCTSQAVPCKIRLPHLDSPTHRHAIDQQIHLHGMHPSSINNRPSISPSPPQLNTPQQPTHHPGLHRTPQAILPSTTFTCPPPIDLPALHQSHQAPHPNNPPSHQRCHATYYYSRSPTALPRSVKRRHFRPPAPPPPPPPPSSLGDPTRDAFRREQSADQR